MIFLQFNPYCKIIVQFDMENACEEYEIMFKNI